MLFTLTVFSLFGCNEEKSDDTASASSEDSALTSIEPEDDNSPSVTSADFWCYVAETGDPVDQWILSATVTDPQGVSTLKSFIPEGGSFQTLSGGEIASLAIVCTPEGLCTASATGATIGASCAQADQFQIEFYVEDEDGNTSTPQVVAGRAGTSAQG